MNTKETVSEYQRHIGNNISTLMQYRNITQKEMEIKCLDAGFNISQGTISNAKRGQGNITISTLFAIAYALDVNIIELLDSPHISHTHNSNINELLPYKDGSMFITNPDSVYIKCYLGIFHVLFYKTSGTDGDIVRGTLHIYPSENNSKCDLELRLKLEDNNIKSKEKIEKIYKGQLVASPAMRSMYAFLTNPQIGEAAMMLFQQILTSVHQVETAMAVAITTASGANRRPTVHRICLSRKKVDAENIEYVKGQLLMNTSDIFLTSEQIDQICHDNNIPSSFKEYLKRTRTKESCYRIPEASLFDSSLNESELFKAVSLIRSQSISPKYNKISRKTDDILYGLLGDRNSNEK